LSHSSLLDFLFDFSFEVMFAIHNVIKIILNVK